jgi:hypothetical protein
VLTEPTSRPAKPPRPLLPSTISVASLPFSLRIFEGIPSMISVLIFTSGRRFLAVASAADRARSPWTVRGSPAFDGNFAMPYAQWSTTETNRSGHPRRAASSAAHSAAAVAPGEPSVPTMIG